MNSRIFYGNITPALIANILQGEFDRGNLKTQVLGDENNMIVQIATRNSPPSGGTTAITVNIRKIDDGITVQVGQQAWLGVAASLGQTALVTFLNPWNIIGRLDDIAQDIESLQLEDRTWRAIDAIARTAGVSSELNLRINRLTCQYCQTANTKEASHCIGCGAPMGTITYQTCLNCGFVLKEKEYVCPNCGKRINS